MLHSKCVFADTENAINSSITRLELDLASLYNPLGISLLTNVFYRQVYRHDESPIWNGLYYQGGAQINMSPAFGRAGLYIEWMPIAVLQLKMQYDKLYFSGNNGSLLSFGSSDDLFGDDELEARKGDEISDFGDRASFQFTFRAQFGKTVLRNVSGFYHYKFPGTGPYYLEREYDVLMATKDQLISNQLFLLFEYKKENGTSNFFGPYHDYVSARKSKLTRQRLGVTWYQERDVVLGVLQNPRWYLQSGIYLQDRNREDELYVIIGIGGDFQLK